MNICDPYSGSPLVAERVAPTLTNHTISPRTPLNILVVDDDADVRDILARLLRRVGFEVKCASDGEDAWEALSAENFDGMITDHDMPRLSGLDLLRRLRAVPSSLPVIMISGRIPWSEVDLQDLLQPGMALLKPFSYEELLTSVRSAFVPNGRSFKRNSF